MCNKRIKSENIMASMGQIPGVLVVVIGIVVGMVVVKTVVVVDVISAIYRRMVPCSPDAKTSNPEPHIPERCSKVPLFIEDQELPL